MTSSTFAPDRPDWTREDTGSVVAQQTITIAPSTVERFGLQGVASYTLFAESAGAGVGLALNLAYEVNPDVSVAIGASVLTALGNPDELSLIVYEAPSYGGLALVTNLDPTNPAIVNVFSSNRAVVEPRYTMDVLPGRTLVGVGGFTMGTPLFLAPADGAWPGVAANVNTGITVQSSGSGVLSFRYLDAAGNQQTIAVAAVTGGTETSVQVALPQCVGQFYFDPAATDPTGTITALVYPARS